MSCGSRRAFGIHHCGNVNLNTNAPSNKNKKKKLYKRVTTFVPPTKFLLGGNIHDPLNLNGLQDEDETVPAVVTKDEVLPLPLDFLLHGNRKDPLNLRGAVAVERELAKRAKKNELPADDSSVVAAENKEAESSQPEHRLAAPRVVDLRLEITPDCRKGKLDRKDKIVSPVIPQPYRPLKTGTFRQIITPDLGMKTAKTPRFRERNTRFQYGNYPRYYGYRNPDSCVDLRLQILEKHRDFFANKDVYDIGCNIGHVSLIIARSFGARSVTGIDIDRYLVDVAKRNVQYYVNCPSPYSLESPSDANPSHRKLNLKYKCYPVSMPIMYGPIYESALQTDSHGVFPKNVRFVHGNYVPESESVLQNEQPLCDTILCLSVTKWIHLNWGDVGLKAAFKRMFAQLRPGGILILEPQSWDSYKRKKSLTETIWRNYQSIQLFPHHFDRYLLSSEVGFSRCQTLAVVNHQNKGFRRAIKVFEKPLPSSTHFVPPYPVSSPFE